MKNTYSPSFPSPPRPSPSPNVDMSGSNTNLNHSSPEGDHNRYQSWPRRERAGFVKSIRKTSSQLFKKDKKDRGATLRHSRSAISILVSEALGVSTAHTTPNILRGFSRSHSKRSGTASMITVDWDPPERYFGVEVGGEGCIHSPTVKATSVSSAVTEPLDPVPTGQETSKEGMCPETASEDPNPLFLPLPPSPPCPPSPLMDLVDPIQPPDDPQEVEPFFHFDDPPPSNDWAISSLRFPTMADIALATPPDRTAQPPPPASAATCPNCSEDKEVPEPYIPPLTAPPTSPQIPNARLSYLLEPVFNWWQSKDIPSYPYLYS